MKKFLQDYGWVMCLGGTLAEFANISFYNWRFYAISVPTFLLVEWYKSGE